MQKIIDLAILAVVLGDGRHDGAGVATGQPSSTTANIPTSISHTARASTPRAAHPATALKVMRSAASTCAAGKFRNAITDRDLAGFIRAGSQAAGMPPFALDDTDMAGIIAYLRNMNSFDAATVKTGNVVRGRAVFEGKGACTKCHRVGRAWLARGSQPDRHRIGSKRRIAFSDRCSSRPAR